MSLLFSDACVTGDKKDEDSKFFHKEPTVSTVLLDNAPINCNSEMYVFDYGYYQSMTMICKDRIIVR